MQKCIGRGDCDTSIIAMCCCFGTFGLSCIGMVIMGVRKKVIKNDEEILAAVFDALRKGASLFTACQKNGISTKQFYEVTAANPLLAKAYQLALADYADRCTDNIRKIIAELKAGEIDNSTAKLLIETEKWLAQKACPEPIWSTIQNNDDENDDGRNLKEIVVKFV